MSLTLVTNKEAILNTNLNDKNNIFNEIFKYANSTTSDSYKQNLIDNNVESIYELIKFLNENDNLPYYIAYGNINQDLHKDIKNLIDRLIFHNNNEKEYYKNELKQLVKSLTPKDSSNGITVKVRLNSLFMYIDKELTNNPIYMLDKPETTNIGKILFEINN